MRNLSSRPTLSLITLLCAPEHCSGLRESFPRWGSTDALRCEAQRKYIIYL